MIVAFDSSVLLLSINPKTPSPEGAIDVDKIAYLQERLMKEGGTIMISTPVLAEVFVKNEDRITEFLSRIEKSAYLKIADLNLRAALELAKINRLKENKTEKNNDGRPYQSIKVDLQIIAISKVCDAERIYTADAGFAKISNRVGLEAILLKDLPQRPEPDQQPTQRSLDV